MISESSYTKKQDELYRMALSDLQIQLTLTEKNTNSKGYANNCKKKKLFDYASKPNLIFF
jgi:hypothetical protein